MFDFGVSTAAVVQLFTKVMIISSTDTYIDGLMQERCNSTAK